MNPIPHAPGQHVPYLTDCLSPRGGRLGWRARCTCGYRGEARHTSTEAWVDAHAHEDEKEATAA